MYPFKFLLILTFMVLFISCKEQTQPEEKVKLAYEYYSDGTVSVETEVKDSLAHGLMKIFFRDGNLNKVFSYNMGERHGPAVEYFPNGQLRGRLNYQHNKLEGPAKIYYKTGELYRESFYANGKLNGTRKYFYKDGKLMAEAAYKNGFPGMGLKEFDQDGKEIEYDQRILIEKINNLAFNNTYTLKIRLSTPHGNTKFFIGELDEGKFLHEGCWPVDTENGVGVYTIIVKRGDFRMETLSISARFTSRLKNQVVLNRKFNLAIDNK